MMFSRAAPTVLFTAFCISVAGLYVTGGARELTPPGQMSASEMSKMDAYYSEMQLALQVNDHARFEELMEGQIAGMQGQTTALTQDVLPPPYHELRASLIDGTPETLDRMLAAHPGLDLNTPQGRYAAVPLIWATSNERFMPDMITRLIEAGADPAFATPAGYTLVHAISSPFHVYGDMAALQRALRAIPPELIDQPSKSGETPLHLAAGNMRTEQIIALLANGADPNRPYPRTVARDFLAGQPPLMLVGADPAAVEALLSAGADPQQRDAQGRRIIDVLTADLRAAEQDLQDRVSASAAEEYDREYVANLSRARDMIRAALDARLAQTD